MKLVVATDEQIRALALAGELAQNAKAATSVGNIPGALVAEPKFDGIRILAHVHEDGATLYSRSGNTYTGRLPHVERELLTAFPAGTWLDGEAVALRVEGDRIVNDWAAAQSALTKLGANAAAKRITFMVFDLIAHAGIDARSLAYAKRRALIESIFAKRTFEAVALTPTMEASDEAHAAFVAQGFEGSMVKALGAPYASGKRGHGWSKVKVTASEEVIVTGFKPGEGGFTGLVGAVIFGQRCDGEVVERGRCSGMDLRTRMEMTQHPEKWLGRVIEVRHMGVMESGAWRHPQMLRVRDDKAARECVWT